MKFENLLISGILTAAIAFATSWIFEEIPKYIEIMIIWYVILTNIEVSDLRKKLDKNG